MSNQQHQAPNSPSQLTGLPLKKRDFSETLPGYGNHDLLLHVNKKQKLDFLQKQAYFNVLHAFKAESPAISSPRILIVKDLMKEWKIDHKTHAAYEKAIKTDPIVKQFRKVSLASDEERKITAVDGNSLNIRIKPNKEDMNKIRDKVIAPVPSWGQVSPGSLVGRWVYIKMPGEEDYLSFLIKQYDAQTETHRLVTALSQKNFEDPCDWIDLRHIPAKDILWKEENPGLPVRKCFLKPGETLLLETSTAQKKKQLKQTGKTSTGIPIIRKVDKGKSIVGAKSPLQ